MTLLRYTVAINQRTTLIKTCKICKELNWNSDNNGLLHRLTQRRIQRSNVSQIKT